VSITEQTFLVIEQSRDGDRWLFRVYINCRPSEIVPILISFVEALSPSFFEVNLIGESREVASE
jgi:hypothetical protein